MYIVIEKHGGWEYAAICTDEEGNVNVFDSLLSAEQEANECQDGIVVGEDIQSDREETMKYLIKEMYETIKAGGTVIHIGDLICQVLGIEATFLPDGKIIEH